MVLGVHRLDRRRTDMSRKYLDCIGSLHHYTSWHRENVYIDVFVLMVSSPSLSPSLPLSLSIPPSLPPYLS